MRAAKRDKSEPAIVEALRKAGWKVMHLTKFDLLIHKPYGGLRMLEVKTDDGSLTKTQEKLIAEGWPLEVVRTPDEALSQDTLDRYRREGVT